MSSTTLSARERSRRALPQAAGGSRALRSPTALEEALGVCRNGFIAVTVFSFFINLLMLTAPVYMLQIFTRVLTSRSTDTLVLLFLIAALALLTLAMLDSIRGFILIRIGTWLDRKVGGPVLESAFAESLATSGAATSVQGLRDLSTVRTFMSGPTVFPLLDAPWTPLFILVMFLMHPIVGWISVIGAGILFSLALINEFATRRLLMESGGASIKAHRQSDAAVRNADAIEAMGMMKSIVRRWHRENAEALAMQDKASNRGATIAAISKFFRFLLQIGVLSAGAWLVLQNEMNPGTMIAASILMSRALQPVDQAISSWKAGVSARGAYRRLNGLLEERPPRTRGMPLPAPSGQVNAERVTFAHSNASDPVIRGVTFQLLPGEAMGLVGPTAAGKTTLARLLIGSLVPRAGHVRLDNMEMSEWDPADRGQHVGYLPQDVELFSGTINENIARMGEVDPDKVIEAAELAGVHEMIKRMPQGYNTPIGEGGAELSGGQRQRIALARAVYGNPRFVVLDEPNASLDNDGEHALETALAKLKEKGSTVVTIAHRPSILRTVDKILVLQAGRVQMFGTRDEVMTKVTSAGQGRRLGTNSTAEVIDQDKIERSS